MKSVLVTGGLGFIGSHLVDRLLDEGHQVWVIDNCTSNVIQPEEWFDRPNLHILTDQVNNILQYPVRFDEIYHLASPVGPAGVLRYAGRMARQIVDDADAVVGAALYWRSKLVFVSTSEVYGGGVDGLCTEETPCHVPAKASVRLEYAIAKLAAELAVLNTCKVTDLHAVVIRPFNVAGPRQQSRGGFVLPRFIEQSMRGEPLTVFGDGRQHRAFTHVTDIVGGLVKAMECGQSGEVYNLGNPANRTTVLDLAYRVCEVVGDSHITFTNGKAVYGDLYEEAAEKYPSAAKAIRELDWHPTRDVRATVVDAYEYMKAQVEVVP
jgi:nucleoside-diphosphate-sugar epimerase